MAVQSDHVLVCSYVGFCFPLFLNWFGKTLVLICLCFILISGMPVISTLLILMSVVALAQEMGTVYSLLFRVSSVFLCLPCHCLIILCKLNAILHILGSHSILSLLAFSFLWFIPLFVPNSIFFFPCNLYRFIILNPFLKAFLLS